MSIEELVAILEQRSLVPTQSGEGWKAHCPAHDDKNPSLSVWKDEHGHIHVKCHARCEEEDIFAALNIDPHVCGGDPQVEKVYKYEDENGRTLFEKLRFKKKKFLIRRPSPDGKGWVWGRKSGWYEPSTGDQKWKRRSEPKHDPNMRPSDTAVWVDKLPKVLYRQPQIKAAIENGTTIYFVEGEKDCENVVALGLEATTNCDGAAEKWDSSYSKTLTSAKVIVIPDGDAPGREHAHDACAKLKGVAAEVRLLELPDLPSGGKDVSDWIKAGHTRDELEKLAAETPMWKPAEFSAEIMDALPDRICRPLSLIRGHAYLATWVGIKSGTASSTMLAIVSDDGRLFLGNPAGVNNAESLDALGLPVSLRTAVEEKLRWSGKALKDYVNGDRPDPAAIFEKLKSCVAHFLDFGRRNFGSADDMAELLACFVFTTYLLEAFPVTGYLWSTGFSGSGKTTLLHVVCRVGYLGQVTSTGGTFAALRDMADYGATLGFDDAENLSDDRKVDSDKKQLILAGNHRGVVVPMKEPRANGTWEIRYVNAFCPRLFSAICLPDPVLSSRAILIPLVKSADAEKLKRDPADDAHWPHQPSELRDQMYSIALANLPMMSQFDAEASKRARISGRDYQPWRAMLGVALWLDEKCGVTGLFNRMHELAVRYQSERNNIEEISPVKLLVMALVRTFGDRTGVIEFAPSELAVVINTMAEELDLAFQGDSYTNAKKVGHQLQRLRIQRASRSAKVKKWALPSEQLGELARAHGVTMGDETTSDPDEPMPEKTTECRSAVCADRAVLSEPPSDGFSNGIGDTRGMTTEDTSAGCDDSSDTTVRESAIDATKVAAEVAPVSVGNNELDWGAP